MIRMMLMIMMMIIQPVNVNKVAINTAKKVTKICYNVLDTLKLLMSLFQSVVKAMIKSQDAQQQYNTILSSRLLHACYPHFSGFTVFFPPYDFFFINLTRNIVMNIFMFYKLRKEKNLDKTEVSCLLNYLIRSFFQLISCWFGFYFFFH